MKTSLSKLPWAKDADWARTAGSRPVCLYTSDPAGAIHRMSLDGRVQETVVAPTGLRLRIKASARRKGLNERTQVTVPGVPNDFGGWTQLDESDGDTAYSPGTLAAFDGPQALVACDTGQPTGWDYKPVPFDRLGAGTIDRPVKSVEFSKKGSPTVTYEFCGPFHDRWLVAATSDGFVLVLDGEDLVLVQLSTDRRAKVAKCVSVLLWGRDLTKPARFTPVCHMSKHILDAPRGGHYEFYSWKMKDPTDVELAPDILPVRRQPFRDVQGRQVPLKVSAKG